VRRIRKNIGGASGHFLAGSSLFWGWLFIRIRGDVQDVSGQGARPNQIIVPPATIFATERAQQEQGQKNDFEQTPAMGAPHIETAARGAAANEQTARVMHDLRAMLLRQN
jgi:hypothetical protein